MDTRIIKKAGAGIALTTALAVGGLVGADLSTENIREESSRYQKTLDDVAVKASTKEKTHLHAVNELVKRRAKGDEPSVEEWLVAETAIDEARAKADSPLLQRLDRFIERMDATDKQVRDEADNLLKEI